jgi:MFS superfamily sulfate permease-like transporter
MLKNLRKDLFSATVVFLVALPLCLGIAQGSEMNVLTGIVAGIIGGTVVGAISKSPLSVSGPAAGLITVVIAANENLGTPELFFLAVFIAGLIQFVLGLLKWGEIAEYIPNAVIKGMMAAIGIILILKQIPHLFGHDKNPFGDEGFIQENGENTFTELFNSLGFTTVGAIIIGVISLAILILWKKPLIQNSKFSIVPAALVVVIFSIIQNKVLGIVWEGHAIGGKHLVSLPGISSMADIRNNFTIPDFTGFGNSQVWLVAIQIAVIASLESLLCLEASEKLDPLGRSVSANRELIAQGSGNTIAGLIGALPITSVIVRTSANVNAGAQTKKSAIIHGFMLLLSLLLLYPIINMIPKAALAAILVFTGYNLAQVGIFKKQWAKGIDAFLPFIITVTAILVTNLLVGILIGLAVGFVFVIKQALSVSIVFYEENSDTVVFDFGQQVSYFTKGKLKKRLDEMHNHQKLVYNFEGTKSLDLDAADVLRDYMHQNPDQVELKGASKHIEELLNLS